MVLFMETPDSKLEKRLVKSLLKVIVSLVIFACGFATLVLFFGEKIKGHDSFIVLIFLLALLPFFMSVFWFFVFRCTYTKRSYISFQASNKDNGNVSILLKVTDSTTKEAVEEIQNLLKKILEQFPKTNSEQK